jgi:very-short-patch-repair endonuclease
MGLVGRRQARQLGVRSHELLRLADSGLWEFAAPRVLRLVGSPAVRGQSLLTSVLDVDGPALASHQAGAWWWGLPGFRPSPAQLVTTSNSTRAAGDVEIHLVRELPQRWGTVLRGVPVVRPELCVLQLCATVHEARAERALDNAWSMRLLSGRSIDLLLEDMGKRGRNGVALLRRLRDERPGDYVPPASNLERRAIEVLTPLGVRWRRQVDLGEATWTGRVDLLADQEPLVVEVQSETYHSALLDEAADAARLDRLRSAGFVVVEVTDEELWTNPRHALARVRAELSALRRRRRRAV